jgi:hypothetical protein
VIAPENYRRKDGTRRGGRKAQPAFRVACPKCGARAGEYCTKTRPGVFSFHRLRYLAAYGGDLDNIGISIKPGSWMNCG